MNKLPAEYKLEIERKIKKNDLILKTFFAFHEEIMRCGIMLKNNEHSHKLNQNLIKYLNPKKRVFKS